MALGLLLASQSAFAFVSDTEARRQIAALQQETQQLREQIKRLEERQASLDAQLKSQGLLELLQQVEALKGEVAKLRGQIELNAHGLDTAAKRQKDLYVDLDTRLRKLEQNAPLPASTGAPVAVPGASTPPPSAATETGGETRAYDSAFNLFKIGNYPAAVVAFQNFLKTYPTSPLASNAQYWIGNAYSAQRDFKACIAAQQKLLATYPDSVKVPDAMLNLASCQAESGERDAARRTLDELIAKYPASNAADIAKRRVNALR